MTPAAPDTLSFARLFLASVVVLGLLALFGIGLKYIKTRGFSMPGTSSRGPYRLRIVESLSLDMKRRIVLLQCDQDEHLLLLGATQDVVIANRYTKPKENAEKEKSV